ncbi:MAG: NAD(P)-dependent oxidoreductase [Candidatus Latescibacterota bacterium]
MSVAKGTVLPLENEAALIAQMTTPSPEVVEAVSQIDGEIMILGVGGKMGPTLAELLVRAGAKGVVGVSRFSNPVSRDYLESVGVRTIPCDLLDEEALHGLPTCSHILLMAGFKFGATGKEPLTWAMNTMLPARVMQRFPESRIVYISSGNVYRYTEVQKGGAAESDPVDPIGEYAQSRLGGERLMQFLSAQNNTPVTIVRLFYATELRYGIILDVATRIKNKEPISLKMGHVNQIWQGDANAFIAQCFPLCASPAKILNVTGSEILSIREMATRLGDLMGIAPVFVGTERDTALLGDAGESIGRFGPPSVSPETMIEWVAWWVLHGGATLQKLTKYDSRTGKF